MSNPCKLDNTTQNKIAYAIGYEKGYAEAIAEFVKFANTMPTVEEDDGYIRPMRLEEMAEQLKEQNNADSK